MHRNQIILLFLMLFLFPAGLLSQSPGDFWQTPDTIARPDTTTIENSILVSPTETIITTDSVISDGNVIPEDSVKRFLPDAEKAIWLGAIIPGFGQIVNRKYWKLPIVYGGFMGCAFAMNYFSTQYQTYKIAYRDIYDNDPSTNSHIEILPPGYTIEMLGGEAQYMARLKSFQDNNRRYRDLSILVSIIYYGLTILEAYVDAHLYDYDISPDLTMRFQPTIINNDVSYQARINNEFNSFNSTSTLGHSNAIGIQWSINLR